MCLTITSSSCIQKRKVRISKICFKNLRIENKNAYSRHHAKWLYEKGIRQPDVDINSQYNEVEKGYHSWKYPIGSNQIFVIPRGAHYFKGEQYDHTVGYVASTIIRIGSI